MSGKRIIFMVIFEYLRCLCIKKRHKKTVQEGDPFLNSLRLILVAFVIAGTNYFTSSFFQQSPKRPIAIFAPRQVLYSFLCMIVPEAVRMVSRVVSMPGYWHRSAWHP